MKISTKRNLAFGLLLTLITFVILYSHCNGNDVCYTFPFLNGRGQQEATKQVLMTVTTPNGGSVVIEKIQVAEKYQGMASETEDSETATSAFQESREEPTNKVKEEPRDPLEEEPRNPLEEESSITKAEPRSVGSTREGQNMLHMLTHTLKAPKRLNPPSDITGAVADEILRKANVSRKELNRSLVRVERVDKALEDELDRGRKIHFSHAQHYDELKKELVREKRVDRTTEEDEGDLIEAAQEKRGEQRNTRELFHDALIKRDNSGETPVIVHPEEDEVTATNLGQQESKQYNLGQIIKEIQDTYSFDTKHSGNVSPQEETVGLDAESFTNIGSVLFNLSRVLREIRGSNEKDSEFGLSGSGRDGKNNRQESGSSGGNDPQFLRGGNPNNVVKGIPITSSLFNSAGKETGFGNLLELSSQRTEAKLDSAEKINSGASEKIRFKLRTTIEEDGDLTGSLKIDGKDKLAENYLDTGTWARVRNKGQGHWKTPAVHR